MPDRYWVGGNGSWDGTTGTKWSATSGGPGGASVPTTADDVFFNAASGAVTVTIDPGNVGARSINCTGFTGTLSGSAAITVAGGFTFVAAMGFTYGGTFTITGSGTLTSAGKTFVGGGMFLNAPAGTVNLGDALSMGFNFSMQAGTFNTNNFNLTCQNIQAFSTGTRAINLGSSTVTSTGSFFRGDITLNAGTSQINMTGASPTFGGNGGTFHNVAFTNTTAGTVTINDNNTFNNLSFTGPSSAGVKQVAVAAGTIQTVNGTLSTTSTAGNQRVWFRSATYGISTSLVVNSAPSLTDADFRDVVVTGTAAPISGTRIGDLRGIGGITFSAPKTVFRIGTGNWSDNQWAATSGGAVSTDNFPLAQDTAVFNQSTTAGTHTLNTAIPYTGTMDLSARTTALTLAMNAFTFYGNIAFGTGISFSGTGNLTLSGRNLQRITNAGRNYPSPFLVDSYGGTVELADAFQGNAIVVANGTFDTAGFSLTLGSQLSMGGNGVRSVFLRSSTVTMSAGTPLAISSTTNLTFDAGSSTINLSSSTVTFNGGGLTYNNVSFTDTTTSNHVITGVNTFANLTVAAIASAGIRSFVFSDSQTITGTLTASGGSAIRRNFIRSDILGSTRTLTVNTLVANDCDFRDIAFVGIVSGVSPTRPGNCGGNSGIIFPVAKTVCWNLAGAQNWSATGWAPTSGGIPDINNFPLAQDTAVFDNTGAAGTVTIDQAWNIGTFNSSTRTTAMTLAISASSPSIHGSWTFGTGVTTTTSGGAIVFSGRGTSTITSNGVAFGCPITINNVTGTVLLADAFSQTNVSGNVIILTTGGFNAQTFNVTTRSLNSTNSNVRTLSLGTGTWTITGVADTWTITSTNLTFNKGTANIILTDTSTAARQFQGGGLAYNRLTIGGATGISTLTILDNNSFTELTSTKTVAHTIALGSTTQQFGAWTVTGTVGNVVTLTGTGTNHTIAGAATSGIDYLAMGSIGFSSLSPGEFYAGANSTGTAGAPVFRTAPPAPRTVYWVGGTGNWSSTARWSTSSGGPSGAAVPTSLDNVIFNSASNATAYTATIDIAARCNQLTVAGPTSGNLTMAGSAGVGQLFLHGNTSFPGTGFTRTFTCAIVLTGSTTGKTLSSAVSLNSSMEINGMGAGWTLTSALNFGTSNGLSLTNGTFNTDGFALTGGQIFLFTGNSRTLTLGSSTVTMFSTSPISFFSLAGNAPLFTFNADTSQITCNTTAGATFTGGGYTFNNVSFTGTAGQRDISGNNTFNNLSFTALSATGLRLINLSGNQVITGTLTLSAGTDATRRSFIRSDTIGTTRTLTVAAFSGTDVDFCDVTVTGAAAPISGTRLGNCGGNTGVTFPAGVNKFWNLVGGGNWSATAWATTGGGTPDANNFPLAQDTCIFEATGLNSGATITMNATWHIGTINMSARTTNTMTLSITNTPIVCGNWINGTGTTITNFGVTFSGRSSQTITSVGRSFPLGVFINSPGGTVTLQDAITMVGTLSVSAGTFNTGNFNVSALDLNSSGTATRELAIGTSTLTLTGSGTTTLSPTGLTVTGSGTISMTSASAKTFAGGGTNLSTVILNQGGNGTLTVTGDNTFRDITATQTATTAASILLGTTTQRLAQFTGKGEATRLLTIQGTSATSPATLIYTGFGFATPNTVNFLTLLGVRSYPLTNTWYAGNNSTNSGTLGWVFEQAPTILPGNGNFFLMFI